MNRIEQTLAALQEKNEKAFITYITAGLPDYTKTKELIKAQEQAGTDIIELGIPFSDPVADGPVIQDASYQAILGGANLEKTFTCMQEMRGEGVEIPIVFMMYYNTVLHYGVEKFAKKCQECGVDGLIIPDLPFEEQDDLQNSLEGKDETILMGFGIRTAADVAPMKEIIDGAIVGSHFINLLKDSQFDAQKAAEYCSTFKKELNELV